MRRNVCFKSTLRQPVRTLLLLLLLGVISFGFISRATEYLVVQREIGRLAGHYRSIGSLESLDANSTDVAQGAKLVSQSPYVGLVDMRRSSSGVLQGLYNADVDGVTVYFADQQNITGLNNSDVLISGELRYKYHKPAREDRPADFQFVLFVEQVFAGYPEYIQPGQSISLRCLLTAPQDIQDMKQAYDSLQMNERYMVRAYLDPRRNSFSWGELASNLTLKPLSQDGSWFYPLKIGTEPDWADQSLYGLMEDLAALEENQHAMLVYGTMDMSAMPAMQEQNRLGYLDQGRWLNRDDDLSARPVAVVHNDFAKRRGLELGDTITLNLRDLKAPHMGYVVAGEDWGIWQDYDIATETFEIVGLYNIRSDSPWQRTLESTVMYIPDTFLPAGYGAKGPEVNQDEYSFILRSPKDQASFLTENRSVLEDMGLRVKFIENGWENFYASARPIQQSAWMNAAVFAVVLLLTLGLVAFLYMLQRRRDFAILRALGVPAKSAALQMLVPIGCIGAVGILLGGLPSWQYALTKAAQTIATLQGEGGIMPSATLSLWWLVGLCIGTITLLMLFVIAGLSYTARRPVLALLQGTGAPSAQKTNRLSVQPTQATQHVIHEVTDQQRPSDKAEKTVNESSFLRRGRPSLYFRLVFTLRHLLMNIRRALLKSILVGGVALCFTLALGAMIWAMNHNKAEIQRLFNITQVKAEIVKRIASQAVSSTGGGMVRSNTVDTIMDTGFVKEAYLEAAGRSPMVGITIRGTAPSYYPNGPPTAYDPGVQEGLRMKKGVGLRGIDLPGQFFAGRGGDVKVEYASGWDENLFTQDRSDVLVSQPVLMSIPLLEHLQMQPGDLVWIYNTSGSARYSFVIAGQYTGTVVGDIDTQPILMALSSMKMLEGSQLNYGVAEFTLNPQKNRDLPQFRQEVTALFDLEDVGTVDLSFILQDEVLVQVVRPMEQSLALMAVLYPITVGVSVVIAAGLSILIMMQSAKEAALMRMLGVTKASTQRILCIRQLSLCLMGLVLGMVVLRQYAAVVLWDSIWINASLYLAGAAAGSIAGAFAITNRMPLELLQVKE